MEKYREQLLAELAQYANRQITEAEPKIYRAVYQRIVKDVEASNEQLVNRLEKLLTVFMAAGILLMLVAVLVVAN